MRKYFIYLIVYSIGGFILERIINLIFLGEYYDNSVLFGPYQPLYGMGILMAIIVYDLVLYRISNKVVKNLLLLITAIITTGISEAVAGYGYEYLYHIGLWNYNLFFTCASPYVCSVPTSLFGFLSFLVIVYLHPFVKAAIKLIPKMVFRWVFIITVLLFLIDVYYTFFIRLA